MINGPDGLTGAIMAVEGIRGATVLLHGPGGCRARNVLLSMATVPREDRRWVGYEDRYYAGYSRVPATYIDGYDLVGGAVQKLEDALEAVRRDGPELTVVIDSPGASLMADNHMGAIRDLGVSDGVMVLEQPTMSVPARRAYGETLAAVAEHLAQGEVERRPGTVCLAGITVMDACWEDVVSEFRGYLEDMGLEVQCVAGAGCTVDELARSAGCELCAVVCPESAHSLIDFYRDRGVKVVVPDVSPVGFDATRSWIQSVAEAAGRDPEGALAHLDSVRRRIDGRLGGMRYGLMRVRGMTLSAAGPVSFLEPLAMWLSSDLGMVPASLVCEDGDSERLERFAADRFGSGVTGRRLKPADLVLCDGNTALRMESGRRCRVSVSTGGAVIGSDGLLPRQVLGAGGAVNILDAVIRASHGR